MSNGQLSLNLFGEHPEETQNFFTKKRSWSASKHRIILKYIQSQCYSLGGKKSFQSQHINYIDGFAGEGKYDEGFGIEDFIEQSKFWKRYEIELLNTDGSPLIALKCAKIFNLEGRVNLRCFFAEADKSRHQKLMQNCRAVGERLEYKIYTCQKFENVLPEIMNDLQGYPSLFFVDTFGVKGLRFEQICLISDYLSQYKGELFLLFHNIQVARHAGQDTAKSEAARMNKASQTYSQNLTELLGVNSDKDWKPKWLELKNKPQQFERWALKYFKQRIIRDSKFNGVASFEIKEKYNDTRPRYSIVACSNHPNKAFGEFLNEFFAEENRLLFYEEDKTGMFRNFLDQEWQRQNKQRKAEIKPRIIELIKKVNWRWMTLKDTITLVILQLDEIGFGLGYLKRSDYRGIIVELFEEGIIETQVKDIKKGLTLKSLIRFVQ